MPSRAGAVSQAQRYDLLQQSFIVDAAVLGRVGEIFSLRNLRIRIGFQHIDLTVVRHAIVETRITAQEKCSIDSFRQALDLFGHGFVDLGCPGNYADFLLKAGSHFSLEVAMLGAPSGSFSITSSHGV